MRNDGYSIVLSGDLFVLYYYPDMNIQVSKVMLRSSFHIDDLYRTMLIDKKNKSVGDEPEIWIG